MVTRRYRLCHLPQRQGLRGPLRWFLPWFHLRWKLHRAYRERLYLQLKLYDFPSSILGSAGYFLREIKRVVDVDVEDRECRRMVIPGWITKRLDTLVSYRPPISHYLRVDAPANFGRILSHSFSYLLLFSMVAKT
jgi:hypothetical protein